MCYWLCDPNLPCQQWTKSYIAGYFLLFMPEMSEIKFWIYSWFSGLVSRFVILGVLFFCESLCYSCLTRSFGFLLSAFSFFPWLNVFLTYCVPMNVARACFVTADTIIFKVIFFRVFSMLFTLYYVSQNNHIIVVYCYQKYAMRFKDLYQARLLQEYTSLGTDLLFVVSAWSVTKCVKN